MTESSCLNVYKVPVFQSNAGCYGILAFTNSFVCLEKGPHVTVCLITMLGFQLITCYELYLPRTVNNAFVASAVNAVANSPCGSIKISVPFLVLAQGF